MIDNIQALEKILGEKCKESSRFPRMPNNYYTQYCHFVNKLKSDIYPLIDAGLSLKSKVPGYYTAHNAEHFDEVVRYAGDLLGATYENIADWKILTPYELYVLLIAIRVHDIGNIHGREDHEQKCFLFLKEHKVLLGGDDAELKIIARIAESHGGKINGNKDTIGHLNVTELVGNIEIRPRLLAAIVRFADEICEHSGRTSKYLAAHNEIPHHNQVYHKYSSAIQGSIYGYLEKRVNIKFTVTTSDAARTWGCEDRAKDGAPPILEVYLIDEILDRLEKMDRERRYCNIYSRGSYAVESIRATIAIVDAETHDQINLITVPELKDSGYPDQNGASLKSQLKEYCGSAFANKYATV